MRIMYSCDTIEKLDNYYNIVKKSPIFTWDNNNYLFEGVYQQKYEILLNWTSETEALVNLLCVGDKVEFTTHYRIVTKIDTHSIWFGRGEQIYKTNIFIHEGRYMVHLIGSKIKDYMMTHSHV